MLPVGFRVLARVKKVRNFGLGRQKVPWTELRIDPLAELGAERVRAGQVGAVGLRREERGGGGKRIRQLRPSLPPGSPTPIPKLQKRFFLPKQNRLGSI